LKLLGRKRRHQWAALYIQLSQDKKRKKYTVDVVLMESLEKKTIGQKVKE
jgi:hypothetical protein